MLRTLALTIGWRFWRDDESGRYVDLARAKADRTTHPRLPRLA